MRLLSIGVECTTPFGTEEPYDQESGGANYLIRKFSGFTKVCVLDIFGSKTHLPIPATLWNQTIQFVNHVPDTKHS